MLVNQSVYFENPSMPDWLFYNFQISFKNKDKDMIKGYFKVWEGILNERRTIDA